MPQTNINIHMDESLKEVKADSPNIETINAMQEVVDMQKNGTGRKFDTVEELFNELNA